MSIESEQRKIFNALSKFTEIPYDHEKIFPLNYDFIKRDIELKKLDALDTVVYASTYLFREDNNMKKDSVADIEYKNAVDSLQNDAWEKKKAIDDDVKIELAELEKKRELEAMKEQVDVWAEEVYARYEALHNKGFAEDLAIELLKIYISKN